MAGVALAASVAMASALRQQRVYVYAIKETGREIKAGNDVDHVYI